MTNAEARFNKSHIRQVYACLAVTCHLHFWQNDRDLLRATVVTRGWNGYRNKSQHRKSALEKKILPPFQQGFEPATFQSRVRRSNHWAIPAPLTRGWNGYRNKSQHRKSTLEKKILPPFQQGFETATFQSRVRCSNHWAIPAPLYNKMMSWCLMSSDVKLQQEWES